MSGLRIAICEDLDKDAEYLSDMIESLGIAAEVSRFENGEDFLASHPAGKFDIAFFDIYMSGISGMEAARLLRDSDDDCEVVFTTTSDEHKAEAWEVEARLYLVKPVDKTKLEKLLNKCITAAYRAPNACPVHVKGQIALIPFNHIYYVEVHNHTCFVHTTDGTVEASTTMTIEDFERLLTPPRFMRCHQSYIVNLSHVKDVGRDFTMKNGSTVFIRGKDLKKCKDYKRELNKWKLTEAGRMEL